MHLSEGKSLVIINLHTYRCGASKERKEAALWGPAVPLAALRAAQVGETVYARAASLRERVELWRRRALQIGL